SLSDIWVKIVAQLRPMGTQVLMRQHGQLMACDGVEARVGITNDKLMRMAQDRLSNVETAFEKVFGHQIRVTMAVVTTEQVVAPAPPSAAPAPRPVPKAAVVTAAEPADVKPNQNPIVEPSLDPSPGTQAAPVASDWQSEGDLERSVKSFAQFFNGQIVNLDEDVTESAQSSTPSTEPGPDVPF
ncbi:MAG: DNA polymerase III subunit gamma/tau, partial [Cyanobacteria bacterium P01_H01_bin.26]